MQSTLFTELTVSEEANLSGGNPRTVTITPTLVYGIVGVSGGTVGATQIGGTSGDTNGSVGIYAPITITQPAHGGH
ncbi:hypothetical protein [Nostoc sp.]